MILSLFSLSHFRRLLMKHFYPKSFYETLGRRQYTLVHFSMHKLTLKRPNPAGIDPRTLVAIRFTIPHCLGVLGAVGSNFSWGMLFSKTSTCWYISQSIAISYSARVFQYILWTIFQVFSVHTYPDFHHHKMKKIMLHFVQAVVRKECVKVSPTIRWLRSILSYLGNQTNLILYWMRLDDDLNKVMCSLYLRNKFVGTSILPIIGKVCKISMCLKHCCYLLFRMLTFQSNLGLLHCVFIRCYIGSFCTSFTNPLFCCRCRSVIHAICYFKIINFTVFLSCFKYFAFLKCIFYVYTNILSF